MNGLVYIQRNGNKVAIKDMHPCHALNASKYIMRGIQGEPGVRLNGNSLVTAIALVQVAMPEVLDSFAQ